MKRNLPVIALAVLSATSAFGEDVPADRDIVQVRVSSNSALIEIAPGYSDVQGCALSGSGWLKIDLTIDKSLFTAALAAATSKQKVGFGLSGCAGGSLDYPVVKRVDVTY